ncbi:hypothetical protein BJP34_23885 [Moorena producens PAL-8-15-08-1]|uniref:Uncharacterized protein n=2 Tax=Moorena TaxID=1155738 RepID=A0A1D8TWN9_9CYAN|nr:hypothetical protein BJP34_23885 [Moorena producens PAL-8-15-08-1]
MNFAQDIHVIGEQLRFDIVYNEGSREDKLRANRHLLTEKHNFFVLFRCGGASRVVNKACRVSEPLGGVGKKPTL